MVANADLEIDRSRTENVQYPRIPQILRRFLSEIFKMTQTNWQL